MAKQHSITFNDMSLSSTSTVSKSSSQGRQPSYETVMETVRGWLMPASPAPVVQSRSGLDDATNHAPRSADLREYGISDCSSSSDGTEDLPQSPTSPVYPKLERDVKCRFQSVSSTESKPSCISGPLHLSMESTGPERQVDHLGDADFCVAAQELPSLTPEGSSDYTSSPISLGSEVASNQAQCLVSVGPSRNLLQKVSSLQQKLKARKKKVRSLKRRLRRTSKALQALLE